MRRRRCRTQGCRNGREVYLRLEVEGAVVSLGFCREHARRDVALKPHPRNPSFRGLYGEPTGRY